MTTGMLILGWIVALTLAVVLIGGFAYATRTADESVTAKPTVPTDKQIREHRSVCVIYNPVKTVKIDSFESDCRAHALSAGFQVVEFAQTTEDEPGPSQARRAMERGFTRVVAAGGDGTVRLVAGTLAQASSEVEFGLLPLGTGNLYARNVGIATDDWHEELKWAFGNSRRRMDIGWLTASVPAGDNDQLADAPNRPDLAQPLPGGAHPFLVISGLGFDARMMAETDSNLKKRIGWAAYVVAGVQNLFSERIYVKASLDNGASVHDLHVLSLFVANSGKLPGGMNLVPDAKPDDAVLDVCAMNVSDGLWGWLKLSVQVGLQNMGLIHRDKLRYAENPLTFKQARTIDCQLRKPHQIQVDGDPIGRFARIHFEVQPAALLLACPQQPRDDNR